MAGGSPREGLYRTIRRLQDKGFLTIAEIDAPRTGAKRKDLALSELGARFLAGVEGAAVDWPVRDR